MCTKDADGMADSADPDQTAPLGLDLGLHCLPRPVCVKTVQALKEQSDLGLHCLSKPVCMKTVQTLKEQSDLGLHCLPRPVCVKT